MARIDTLFELIKSLSKSEKRYFKLFASMQGGDKKYVLLFDAIDAQEKYDEEELKERFRQERFVRQFSVAKNYLYSLILKSLRQYSAGSSEQYLLEMLIDIGILERKGLTPHARRVTVKAARIAHDEEQFFIGSYLSQLRRRFQTRLLTTQEGIDEIAREQREILDKLKNLMEYHFLFDSISRPLYGGEDIRTQEQLKEAEQVMRHPLLQGNEQALSISALLYYHWIHAVSHFVREDYQAALASLQKIVESLDANADLLRRFRRFYLSAMQNTLLLHRRIGDKEGFAEVMQKLRDIGQMSGRTGGKRDLREEGDIFVAVYSNMLLFYLNEVEFEQAAELIPEIEQGLERYGDYLNEGARMAFLGNITYICFALGWYHRALDYNNVILLNPPPWDRSGSYYAAQLANLVIHYELGNFSLLKHLIVSVQRSLVSRNVLHSFEQTFLDFMGRIMRARSKESRTEIFRELRARLQELESDPLERQALRYFGYIEWVESKIQGKSFTQVAKEMRE